MTEMTDAEYRKTMSRIETWMRENFDSAVDRATDEVSLTKLAEGAAHAYDFYDGDDVPEELFELAFVVAQDKLSERNRRNLRVVEGD